MVKDASGLVDDALRMAQNASWSVSDALELVKGMNSEGQVKDLPGKAEDLKRKADELETISSKFLTWQVNLLRIQNHKNRVR